MTELRTILFASDLSPESDGAFEHARFLAEHFGARLTIYHGLEMPRGQYDGWIDATDDRRARWEKRVREELTRRARAVKAPHEVVVEGGLVGGHYLVDLALLERIHEMRPDLTVMATRGRKGFASFFLGSVTEQVVQHAGRPVLCVRKSPHGLVLPYRRLLVPTDLSAVSARAFSLAAFLARRFEATVHAIHVVPPPALATLVGAPAATPRAPAAEDLRKFLMPEFDGLTINAEIATTGAPWNRIVQAAVEHKSDVIVMATQGHDSVKDGIIGSNAERVLRHAPCPVLVV
jgi:nucleotide-binding universal stress UspA family protein